MSTLVPDENSMKDPLCNSSFGSMVSLDYVTPDTVCTDTKFEDIQNSFGITHKLILDNSEEVENVKMITNTNPSRTRSLLSHDEVIKWAKAKVLVSVLCLEKVLDHSEASHRWKGQVADFQLSASYAELPGIDGEPFEFEWNILPGLASLLILQKIESDLQGRNIEPEELEDRIIFMSISNDIDWTAKGNEVNCISKSDKVKMYAPRLSQEHWTFLGPGDEKKWYGNRNYKRERK